MKYLAIVAFLFCASTIANAQQSRNFGQTNKPVLCGPKEVIFQALTEPDINEKPVWQGRREDNRSDFYLFLNFNTRAFTLLEVGDTVGCILGLGQGSQFFTPPSPARGVEPSPPPAQPRSRSFVPAAAQ